MSQIIKCFLGIFFILMLLVVGMSISVSMINTIKARNFSADVITKIENSDFYSEVMNECMQQAEDKGYTLEMNIYTNDTESRERNVTNVSSATITESLVEYAYMTEVILEYENYISFLDIQTNHRDIGYAR